MRCGACDHRPREPDGWPALFGGYGGISALRNEELCELIVDAGVKPNTDDAVPPLPELDTDEPEKWPRYVLLLSVVPLRLLSPPPLPPALLREKPPVAV